MDWFELTMGLLGGLAFFLYGLEMMSGALKAIAGNGMRTMLGRMTKNRLSSAFSGAFVTAMVQSSSVTTVLVVGFISAGLMSLPQSIGIIMGANIGSTVTAQLVAFKITDYALMLVIVGFGLMFLGKREKLRQLGLAIGGMGLIFFGMGLMSDSTRPLREFEPFIEVMRNMDRPLLGILVGLAFTALVQSSAATTGIVIVLATQGFITLEAGIALAFGANVGTCVTAVLASMGKPTEARRAAAVHVLFNVIGVLIWLPIIDVLAEWVRAISPTYPELSGDALLAKEVPRQIANAHTIFNVANTMIFIWLDVWFANLVIKLIPEKPIPLPEAAQPLYLDRNFLQTPALAVDRVALETGHVGDLVLGMVDALHAGDGKETKLDHERIETGARDVELLVREILDYGRHLSERNLTADDSLRLQQVLEIVNQVRGIADTLMNNLSVLAREWDSRQLKVSEETKVMFAALLKKIKDVISTAIAAGKERDRTKAEWVIEQKGEMKADLETLSQHLSQRLLSDAPDRAETYRLESRVLEIMARLHFFARQIAKVIAENVDEEPRIDQLRESAETA
ncbi:MAG: Na/Pi cotransporter family protein [bacterium]